MNASVRGLLRVFLPLVGNAPRRARRASARRLALAAAVGMIHRVHGDAAHRRPPALPAVAAGLADALVLVLDVADLPDRRPALLVDLARLAGGQPDERPAALARHQLRARAGRADHLAALAALELDVVDRRAQRDRLHRERVPHDDVRLRPRRRSWRRPPARPGPGCSAARRRRSRRSAMFAVRFGSYSIVSTVPGMSRLSRRKSITR